MSVIDEIHYLAGILGTDRPDIRRLLQTAALHPEKAHRIHRHMLMLLRKEGYDLSDLPVFGRNLPEEIPGEGIFLGRIVQGNGKTRDLYIPLESFRRHTMVVGMTGSGKSTLVKWLILQLAG